MAVQKPQKPLTVNGNEIYPVTSVDQVVMGDGSRLCVDASLSKRGQPADAEKTGNKIALLMSDIANFTLGTLVDYDTNVKAINHRGFSATAPENTIPAYIMSKKMGFSYAEADVSFTSDGVAVLLHDSTIDRTSDGTGSISEMTYAEASQYDYGSWKNEAYSGTKIPTFAEFIKLCKSICLHPYIELKNNGAYTEAQILELVATVKKCGMEGKVTWISFSADFLGYVKTADPTARLGYLVSSVTNDVISTAQNLKVDTNEVFIDSSDYDEEAVQLCLDANLPLEVWTINDEDTILALDTYVTGVTSDNLVAGKVLYNSYVRADITDCMVIDIGMSDNGNNRTGDTAYNASLVGNGRFDVPDTYQTGVFVVDGSGALTIPTDFMQGEDPWTIAFAIENYAVNSANTFCRVARGSKDTPSIFYKTENNAFMFKLAGGTVWNGTEHTDVAAWFDSDFCYPWNAQEDSALIFTVPNNERTVFVFRNDGEYISLWVNGEMKAKQVVDRYTSDYHASTFAIGDDAGVGYDMTHMECSMLKAWTRALTAGEIASL